MFKYLKEYRFYITLFIFILIPIVAIDTSTRSPRDYRLYDRVITWLTLPIQVAISWTLDSGYSLVQNYIYLWDVQKHNVNVFEENRRLLNTIVSLQETQEENRRLRDLLGFKESHDVKAIVARVIATDISKEFQAIRINRGENSGVKKDMAVVNSDGIIGRVLRVSAATADVVTILDIDSGVDAIVRRSRARGVVKGLTDEYCELKFALRTDDVVAGDVLVSSGMGGIFPKGISVGVVSRVDRKPYGITQFVEIDPSVDFSKIEEVLVITQTEVPPMHVVKHPLLHSNLKELKDRQSD